MRQQQRHTAATLAQTHYDQWFDATLFLHTHLATGKTRARNRLVKHCRTVPACAQRSRRSRQPALRERRVHEFLPAAKFLGGDRSLRSPAQTRVGLRAPAMAQLQNKRASSAARNIVFIAAVALLMAAGGVLLSFGGGGSWTATGEGGPSCGARVCPPCQDAPQIAEAQRQQQDLDASPEAELQNCPPPPDCPSAEPAEGRACPACIAPADCPPAAAAAAAATVDVADPAAAEAADLLCGGPDAIPSVADALDSANEAILAAANRSFAQWAETGFSLENLLTSAEVVGASGFHDTFVWVEVRGGGEVVWGIVRCAGAAIGALVHRWYAAHSLIVDVLQPKHAALRGWSGPVLLGRLTPPPCRLCRR